jgi:hypothetical protein
MFRLIQPSSGQIRNIVLVQSLSAHYGIPYFFKITKFKHRGFLYIRLNTSANR